MRILSLLLALNVLVATTGFTMEWHSCNAQEMASQSSTEENARAGDHEMPGCCSGKSQCGQEDDAAGCCTVNDLYFKGDITAAPSPQQEELVNLAVALLPHIQWEPVFSLIAHDIPKEIPGEIILHPPLSLLQVFRC